jgi:hypothetical protein
VSWSAKARTSICSLKVGPAPPRIRRSEAAKVGAERVDDRVAAEHQPAQRRLPLWAPAGGASARRSVSPSWKPAGRVGRRRSSASVLGETVTSRCSTVSTPSAEKRTSRPPAKPAPCVQSRRPDLLHVPHPLLSRAICQRPRAPAAALTVRFRRSSHAAFSPSTRTRRTSSAARPPAPHTGHTLSLQRAA